MPVVELTSNLNQNGSCSHSIWLRFLSISSAKSCGRPNDIPNGKIIGYVYSFKEKIRYECNDGYNLKGPSYRTCQANEKWGDKDPVCEGKIFDLLNIRIISYVTVISHVSITVLWGKYIFFKFTIVFPCDACNMDLQVTCWSCGSTKNLACNVDTTLK